MLAREFVAMLNQQPVVLLVARPAILDPHQHPFAVQPFAFDHELQLAFSDRGSWIAFFRHPVAAIPELDRATAILALGNSPLEIAVIKRVIFDLHRQAFVVRIDGRTLSDGP